MPDQSAHRVGPTVGYRRHENKGTKETAAPLLKALDLIGVGASATLSQQSSFGQDLYCAWGDLRPTGEEFP